MQFGTLEVDPQLGAPGVDGDVRFGFANVLLPKENPPELPVFDPLAEYPQLLAIVFVPLLLL